MPTNDARINNGRPIEYLTKLYWLAVKAGLVNPPTAYQLRQARKTHQPRHGRGNLAAMAEAIALAAIGEPIKQGTPRMHAAAVNELASLTIKIGDLVADEWNV